MDITNLVFISSLALLFLSVILMLIGMFADIKIIKFISFGVFILFCIGIYGVCVATEQKRQ